MIGRPGQYEAATFIQDTRLPCTAKDNYDELSIDCGAKVERWASTQDAKARAADIQQKLKAYGLGAAYDYVRDGLVLRISGGHQAITGEEVRDSIRRREGNVSGDPWPCGLLLAGASAHSFPI